MQKVPISRAVSLPNGSRASDRKNSTPQLRQETAALRNFDPAYDRNGSFTACPVRPKSGHSAKARVMSKRERVNPISGSAAQSMSARPESGVLRCRKLRVASVDDLICSHKHCCGYCQTECFQRFLVNDETEVGWLLEWEIGGARSS